MTVRIAIPEPTGNNAECNQRLLPPCLEALQAAGAGPVVIPLHEDQEDVARALANVHGILLPDSFYDIDPQRFGETPLAECGLADPLRTAVDELLIQDAFSLYKPILAIGYGAQSLNVWCNGSLYQDLPRQLGTEIHQGSDSSEAGEHALKITPGTRLAAMLPEGAVGNSRVTSSHHQAIHVAGDKLRVSAVAEHDGVIEAVELDSTEHFVVAVQWDPASTYAADAFSRSIFAAFVHAAGAWKPRKVEESVAGK